MGALNVKLAGHTMATPEFDVFEALRFFKKLGLDGAEIVVQTGYRSGIPYEADDAFVQSVRDEADALGLAVAATTPYLNRYNALDEPARQNEAAMLRRVVDMTRILAGESVRIYGGAFADDETDSDGAKLAQLVKSLRECGDYAAQFGIRLAIENHFGTMTTTARRTMEVVRAIDRPNVGVLYDQANLAFFPAEEYPEALALQKDSIFYVHVKDLVYRGGAPQPFRSDSVSHISEELRTVYSKFPGDGVLDWPAILRGLKGIGYDGWLSLEYERRWGKLDLPAATEGLPVCVERVRRWLAELA